VAVLAVFDTMVMLQWAALPAQPDRQHATVRALTEGRIRLAMSQRLFDEIRGVLFRPELQQRLPTLTHAYAAAILEKILEFADWFEDVPPKFSLPSHAKDNHLFDLAIESQSSYLVTWESRLLKLREDLSPEAMLLRDIAPQLLILTPKEFSQRA
jgi:putative PIN family toxin of toxin-antitoxin system